jgi:hypothetical protein
MTKTPAGGDKPTAESLLDTELEAAIMAAEIDAAYADRVDPNHPILTVAEQVEALKKADLKVTAERKKQALADLQKKEEERLMGAAGQMTGDPVKDELVFITLDLAEHSNCITLGLGSAHQHVYHHGQTYKVPRHVADTLREIQARGWNHQLEIEGKGMAERFRRPQNQVLSGKAA